MQERMIFVQDQRKEFRRIIRALVLTFILLFFFVLFVLFYVRVQRPTQQATREALAIAEKYAQLDKVDAFYKFVRRETYFSFTGTNQDNEAIAVIIPKSGGDVVILEQSVGLSEEEVRQRVAQTHQEVTIEKVALGLYEKEPVWEVTTKQADGLFTYYLLSFQDGTEVNVLKDI